MNPADWRKIYKLSFRCSRNISKWFSFWCKKEVNIIVAKDQRLFAFRPCSCFWKNHSYFDLLSEVGNIYKHWSSSEAENFVFADRGNEVVGKQATHCSFFDYGYYYRPFLQEEGEEEQVKAAGYYAGTPACQTSWLVLTGATEMPQYYLSEFAKSWYRTAKVLTGNECTEPILSMSSGPGLPVLALPPFTAWRIRILWESVYV